MPLPEHYNQPVSPVESFHSHWQPPKSNDHYLTSAQAAEIPSHAGNAVHRVEDGQNEGSHHAGFATAASALGGPSDWEYYCSSPQNGPATVPMQTAPHVPQRQSTALEVQRPSKSHSGHQQQANTFNSELDAQQVSPISLPTRRSPTPIAALQLNDVQSIAVGHSKLTEDGSSEAETSSPTSNGPQRAGTIDGIIDAWSRPLAIPRPSTAESVVPTMNELSPDIDPEYSASLSRFIATLRHEARADSDAERFKIFNAFMQKEYRLRKVLYNIDEAAKPSSSSPPPPPASKASHVAEDMNQTPVAATTLPASSDKAQTSAADIISGVVHKGALEGTTPEVAANSSLRPKDSVAVLSLDTSPGSTDESYVVVDGAKDESEYSPGGRPRLSRPVATRLESNKSHSLTAKEIARNSTQKAQTTVSPIDNAPMFLGDYVTAPPESPGRHAPMVVGTQESGTDAGKQGSGLITSSGQLLKFEPQRPVYTPFRYQEVKQTELHRLTKEEPADQAYSALRNQTSDSGRLMTHSVPPSENASAQDGFVGLLRQQSHAVHNGRPLTPALSKLRSSTPSILLPSNPVADAISTIRVLVPNSFSGDGDPSKLSEVNRDADSIPDQFGFIKDLVIHWDNDNRKLRVKQDQERQTRQEESEAHIDSLFNDNEIGYSDIATMEAEFKLDEAHKKYEEDQQELDSFTKQIFAAVTERLENELSRLNTVYVLAVDALDLESCAASNLLSQRTSQAGQEANKTKTSQAMEAVIKIFNKIQIRHQKLAEAHFERERRRKKLELTVLQANGDNEAVTTLEEDFASAEKLQILQEAQEKDKRANKLVESFDRAAVRAMADNQAYVDDLQAKLKKLDAVSLKSPASQEAGEFRDVLQRVEQALLIVANDSKQILAISNIAEKLLNDADYNVSFAKARMENASSSSLEKLREEKQKEDEKIHDDFESRQSSLAKGPADVLSARDSILVRLGDDPERQERLQKALEAAKMRNANKEV